MCDYDAGSGVDRECCNAHGNGCKTKEAAIRGLRKHLGKPFMHNHWGHVVEVTPRGGAKKNGYYETFRYSETFLY
jgi:hypothetical protein